ncbi:phosphotransferase family protein [Novosphingobium lentum]|uniref:phosphotransferase family protein n=1 Tax=Novosphingobium lentum TaxID=145287 RepID=UPI00082C1183|nr:phosphotransferase family protein [Novosphingobium lentum]
MTDDDIRRHPSDAFIAEVRARFPTEREVDTVLTRKMRRRNGPSFRAVALETLVSGVERLIAKRLGYEISVEDARWLSGGASKLQMRFDLHWRGEDGAADAHVVTPLVVRMEPAASVTESSRRREFEVIRAAEGTVPVPHAYWMDPDAEFLPYPAMVYGFATGSAKPSQDAAKVTGLGQNYGPALRARLAPQFVDYLARIHNIPIGAPPVLASFDRPEVGSNASIIKQVNAARRIWEEDRIEDEPVMAVVYKWLIRNAPPIDHVSIVHGDYRSGNFLFDEQPGEITAWLDWEGAVLGDRHQDLTYAALPIFQHYAEDGETILVSGMMPEAELFAAYEQASGLPVDPKRLGYFGVFNRYLVSVLLLAASSRAARCAATHQDVLLNHVSGMGYLALSDLRDYFRSVTA